MGATVHKAFSGLLLDGQQFFRIWILVITIPAAIYFVFDVLGVGEIPLRLRASDLARSPTLSGTELTTVLFFRLQSCVFFAPLG